MSAEIRIMVFRVGALPVVETLPADDRLRLAAMQKLVGGYIECVCIDRGLDLWCNDSGLIDDLPVNTALGQACPIRGDYFVARTNDEGDTVGLTDDDISQLLATYDRERVAEGLS